MTVGNAYLIYQLDWPMKQIHNIIELAGPTCSAKQVGRRGDLNSLANSDNCVCVCTANDSFGLLFCNAKAGQARGIAQTVKHVHVVNNWTPPQKINENHDYEPYVLVLHEDNVNRYHTWMIISHNISK